MTDSAFAEITRYVRSSVSVICPLLDAQRSVGACVQRDADRVVLVRQVTIIAATSREATFSDADPQEIAERHGAAMMTLRVPAPSRHGLLG